MDSNNLLKFPTFNEFVKTSCCQNFSFSDSIIYYFTKNPSSSKLYEKLIASCKYFFIKNSILVIPLMKYEEGKWKVATNPKNPYQSIQFDKIMSKIWIKAGFYVMSKANLTFNSVIQKIFKSDVRSLEIQDQVISFNDFLLMISKSAECCLLERVKIEDSDGSEVQLETILANIFPLNVFGYLMPKSSKIVTANTAKNILKLKHFDEIKYFYLNNIPESFDIDAFYDSIKRKKHIRISLIFTAPISADYIEKLQTIVNDILAATDERKINISFPGQNEMQKAILWDNYAKT